MREVGKDSQFEGILNACAMRAGNVREKGKEGG